MKLKRGEEICFDFSTPKESWYLTVFSIFDSSKSSQLNGSSTNVRNTEYRYSDLLVFWIGRFWSKEKRYETVA